MHFILIGKIDTLNTQIRCHLNTLLIKSVSYVFI
uniref:Uncharacterized protein n=1 Tax=Podoviridae sp. ctQyH19 TaxID=2825249 RepID=A0A8S5UR16_9CAUD|nr:MAG TPA: hypothetical protein [Podoviridae sp. ctQyH19]